MVLFLFLADALLTQPVNREATILPTVNDLKRKIILKHKKLSGTNETFTVPDEESKYLVVQGFCLPPNSGLTITVLTVQAPIFCANCVSVECIVTWSTLAHKLKFPVNL